MRSSNTPVITQKGNLKTGVSRKQRPPNFPKNKHFLPPLIRTTRFDICRFALLPTNTDKVYSILQYIKKLYGLFMDGFNFLKVRATSRRQFTFYH